MGRFIDLTGQSFGWLTVEGRSPNNYVSPGGQSDARWDTLCACGRRKAVRGSALRAGSTASCGCHGLTEAKRFWRKVEKTETCWLWAGATSSSGYGTFRLANGRKGSAHRVAYEWARGPVQAGLQLDHLCRVRNCVNPSHLEEVTPRVNTLRSPTSPSAVNARKTHCDRGHLLDGQNLFVTKVGGRVCRSCKRSGEAARRNTRAHRVRAWASAHGISVKTFGPIAAEIYALYDTSLLAEETA